MDKITNVLSDEALLQILKFITLSSNAEPYISDIAPANKSTFSSIKIMDKINEAKEEIKQYASNLVARVKHLEAELVNVRPTLETAEIDVMYYYSLTEDGVGPYQVYLKITENTLLDLGCTEAAPVGLVDNFSSDSSVDAASARCAKILYETKLDIQQNASQAGKGVIVGSDGKLTLGPVNSDLVLGEREW